MAKSLEEALLEYVEIDPAIHEPWQFKYELVVSDDYTNETVCKIEKFDFDHLVAMAPDIEAAVEEYIDNATEQVL